MSAVAFSVGLEQGADGAVLAHCLSLPGCVAAGPTPDAALQRLTGELARWLDALQTLGEPVPAHDAELELAVDEWVESDARVAPGESTVLFEHDQRPLTDDEIAAALRRLGDLRGRLLARVRRMPEPLMEQLGDRVSLRRTLDELARAQWQTLSGLGASPLAEVPERVVGRLDTAMALIVQQFTALPPAERARLVQLDAEWWTPRKVLRRLLWLEWALGGAALSLLPPTDTELPVL